MERIYLVLVQYDEVYKHPDLEWHGYLHKLSCAGVYNNKRDANEKRNNIIKEEGVYKEKVKIQSMDVNKNMDEKDYACLIAMVEYE